MMWETKRRIAVLEHEIRRLSGLCGTLSGTICALTDRLTDAEGKIACLSGVVRVLEKDIETLKKYSDRDNIRYWELYERIGKLEKRD